MPQALDYVFIGLAALMAGITVWLLLSRNKLEQEIAELKTKLVTAEASHASQFIDSASRKKVKAKEREDGPQKELVAARRDLAHLKDELRRSKDDARERESALKEKLETFEKKLAQSEDQNRSLVETLREKEREVTLQKAQAKPETRHKEEQPKAQPSVDKHELASLKQRNNELERQLRAELEKEESLQNRLTTLQQELRKWREASTAFDGKPLDPSLFLRWRDRAIEGKRMYTLMRRLREMSDEKLVVYQQGIEALATHILRDAGVTPPELRPGEVRADRLLATAWALVRDGSPHSPSSPTRFETNEMPSTTL